MGGFTLDLGDYGDSLADIAQTRWWNINFNSTPMGHPVSSHLQQAVSAWRASMNVSLVYFHTDEFDCQILKWP